MINCASGVDLPPPSLPRAKLVGNSRRDKISQIGIEVRGKSTFVKKSINFGKVLCIDLKLLLDHESIEDLDLEWRNVVSGGPLIVCV